MKKIILVSLLASSVFLNTACDDSEIAAGIIGVGVGVGIAAGSDHDHHRHDRPDYGDGYRDGRRDGRHDGYRPGYGPGYGRGPGRGPGYGPGYGRGHGGGYRGYALTTTLMTDAQSVDSDVAAFADKYKISTVAAQKVQTAFDNVKAQGTDSFASIGLSKKDIRSIAKRDLPDSSSIKAMAGKLDISEAQSRDLIQDLIKEFDTQAADVNSPLWQACIAKGKWRTPENLYCTKTSWNACSPETGATLCY